MTDIFWLTFRHKPISDSGNCFLWCAALHGYLHLSERFAEYFGQVALTKAFTLEFDTPAWPTSIV